jgi:hypothetical protein
VPSIPACYFGLKKQKAGKIPAFLKGYIMRPG